MTEQEQVVQILHAARALIEQGWCQGAWAVDKKGNDVGPTSGPPVAWCLSGAIIAASMILNVSFRHQGAAVAAVARAISTRKKLYRWNDAEGRTQQEVMDAFDRAIASAEQGVS